MTRSPATLFLGCLLALSSLPLVSPANAAVTVTGKPKVSFFAEGSPGALDIEGTTSAITVTDDGTRISFAVPVLSVATGIPVRDDHMWNEFLQAAQFPNLSLSFARADIAWPTTLGQEAKGTLHAAFTAHGVEAPVDVSYAVKRSKTGYRVIASFKFVVTNYNISIPSYVGVTVDPAMYAEVNLDLVDA